MKSRFFSALRTTTGILLSAAAAVIIALLASGHPGAAFVPLVFAVVLILLSWRFGAGVSVVGSLLAALIFARFPSHTHVADSAGHNSLVWMILIAVAGSYLLFPTQQHLDNISRRSQGEGRTRQQR